MDDHRRVLKIKDSQEMMVGIAYGMPFELQQFELFHVSLHIDATADSNKEGRPLVTVTSKDSFGHMFFVLRAPPERMMTLQTKRTGRLMTSTSFLRILVIIMFHLLLVVLRVVKIQQQTQRGRLFSSMKLM